MKDAKNKKLYQNMGEKGSKITSCLTLPLENSKIQNLPNMNGTLITSGSAKEDSVVKCKKKGL